MIYQYNKGHSVDTRLVKGQGASAGSAAEEEDEEG
jgi:hypothetical protein